MYFTFYDNDIRIRFLITEHLNICGYQENLRSIAELPIIYGTHYLYSNRRTK